MRTFLTETEEFDQKFFDIDGEEIVLFNIEEEYFAMRNFCPHMEGPLGRGLVQTDSERKRYTIQCPCHGWEFDIETGKATFNDRHAVRTYDVFVDDGKIYLEKSD